MGPCSKWVVTMISDTNRDGEVTKIAIDNPEAGRWIVTLFYAGSHSLSLSLTLSLSPSLSLSFSLSLSLTHSLSLHMSISFSLSLYLSPTLTLTPHTCSIFSNLPFSLLHPHSPHMQYLCFSFFSLSLSLSPLGLSVAHSFIVSIYIHYLLFS